MENKDQSEQTEVKNVSFKDDEKAARKARQTERRLARRAKRNARIARGRHLKNLFIWFLGVLCLPTVIAVASFVVPISIVTGKDGKIVSEELSNKSLFEAVKFVAGNSGELGFADFPIVANAFSDLQKTQIGERDDGAGGTKPITVGDLIYIDTDKLNTIKFGSSDFSGDVSSCIEVVATIDSLGGASALGDFGGLSVFTDEELAGTVAEIDARGETAEEKKQYYYKSSDGAVVYEAAETVYERAFNDDGALVEKLAALSDTDKSVVKLYYPPLEKVKIGELKDIIGDSIGRTTISSLLETLGGDNDMIIDILGENTTIKGLKDFDVNATKLNIVLEEKEIGEDGYDNNKKLWDVLKAATHKDALDSEPVTIGDLATGFDMDSVKLNVVIEDNAANAELYSILRDATGKTDNGNITIGDLSVGITTNDIKLSSVLELPDDDPLSANYNRNRTLYDILLDMTKTDPSAEDPVTEYDDIKIKHLNNIETDRIHLSTVLDVPTEANGYKNKSIYSILRDATGVDGATDDAKNKNITIAHISGTEFDIGNVHLSAVLEEPSDTADPDYATKIANYNTLTALIAQATGKESYSAVTVSDLSEGFEVDNIKLTTVLKAEGNESLYDILLDLIADPSVDAYSKVTVGNLSGLDTDNLHLTTVIPSSDNKLLKPLLERNPTIGTLGDTINDIDVSEIFVVECFTEDSSKATDTNAKYTKSTVGGVDHYDLSASGTYYISNEAKVWLFMFYERATGAIVSADVDTKGSITKYEKKSVTFGNMEDGMSDTSDAFMNATVKQLIQSGILTESPSGKYALLYGNSFTDVLEASLIP